MEPNDIDIGQVLLDARNRWLKPVEVCNILKNFKRYEFQLNREPPVKPPSGSLFLFDRKVVRYFRKDGHNWRKKKDGKTVREAHEKLKAGSVDVLHCYYAHSEVDERFQRRCYWLLDGVNENIVLVHYREVPEGSGRLARSINKDKVAESPSGSHLWSQVSGAESASVSEPDVQLMEHYKEQLQRQQQQQQQQQAHGSPAPAQGTSPLANLPPGHPLVALAAHQQALLPPAPKQEPMDQQQLLQALSQLQNRAGINVLGQSAGMPMAGSSEAAFVRGTELSNAVGASSGNSLASESMEQDQSQVSESWPGATTEDTRDTAGGGSGAGVVGPAGASTAAAAGVAGAGQISLQALQQQQLQQILLRQLVQQLPQQQAPLQQLPQAPGDEEEGHGEDWDDGEGDGEGDAEEDWEDSGAESSPATSMPRSGSGAVPLLPVPALPTVEPTAVPAEPEISIPLRNVMPANTDWLPDESSSARAALKAMQGLQEFTPSPSPSPLTSTPAATPTGTGTGGLGLAGTPGVAPPGAPGAGAGGAAAAAPGKQAASLGVGAVLQGLHGAEGQAGVLGHVSQSLQIEGSGAQGQAPGTQPVASVPSVGQILDEIQHVFPKDDSTHSELKAFRKLDSFDNPEAWLFSTGGAPREFPKDDSMKSELKAFRKLDSFDNPESWPYSAELMGGQQGAALDFVMEENPLEPLEASDLRPEPGGMGQGDAAMGMYAPAPAYGALPSAATAELKASASGSAQHPSVVFNVLDISPPSGTTKGCFKLLVVGTAIRASSGPPEPRMLWGCKFGDFEVPADEVMPGVLRCLVPPRRAAGPVLLTVTCSLQPAEPRREGSGKPLRPVGPKVPCSEAVTFTYTAEATEAPPTQANIPKEKLGVASQLCSLEEWQLGLLLVGHVAELARRRQPAKDLAGDARGTAMMESEVPAPQDGPGLGLDWAARLLSRAEEAAASVPPAQPGVCGAIAAVSLEALLQAQLPALLRALGPSACGALLWGGSQKLSQVAGGASPALAAPLQDPGAQAEAPSPGAQAGLELLHMLAGLGWDWAVPAWTEAAKGGQDVNARDPQGCTPLHWAAAKGRENMVVALLDSGAQVAVRSLVPENPHAAGLTPADLAEQQGYAGIAAYLSEATLKSSLSRLTLDEGKGGSRSLPTMQALHQGQAATLQVKSAGDMAVQAAEKAVVSSMGHGGPAGSGVGSKAALEESLSAIRRTAEAAARIQAVYELHKERMRRREAGEDVGPTGMDAQGTGVEGEGAAEEEPAALTEEQARLLLATKKIQSAYRGHKQLVRQKSATAIQSRFRGWQKRKEYQRTRQHVIKLQAHIKGHIARVRYQKLRLAMGVLTKAIMRWRSFRKESRMKLGRQLSAAEAAAESTQTALNRMQAMAESEEARAQYSRMLQTHEHILSSNGRPR